MKKLIISIGFVLLFVNLTYSQDYHKLLGDTNEWYVFFFEGAFSVKTHVHITKGDKVYKKINYNTFVKSDAFTFVYLPLDINFNHLFICFFLK